MTKRIQEWKDPIFLGGAFVFLLTQIVYLLTLTRSCPFWDSGEFIATSYVMGIPHPPGTPLYVLIGRVFSMIPIGEISARVNYLSAIGSTMAALFTYLVIVQLARRWTKRTENRIDILIAVGGGIVGALFTAFGRTFWENAVEAEVYALSSFAMIFCVWLILKWEESGWRDGQHNNNLLLLIGYLLFVSVGIHMGTFLVGPPIFLFALLVSSRTLLNRDTLTMTAYVVLSVIFFYVAKQFGASPGVGLGLSALLFAALAARKWKAQGKHNLVFWLVALAVIGLSVQLFMIVRARLDPPINEADPNNWKDLWLVLSRDQYKPPNPFTTRKAAWDIQFTKHFWRYFHDQYHLGIRPAWFAMALPFMVGIVGAIGQALKDRKRFVLVLGLVLITTVFLVFYLNFQEKEVRDRDYFFVAGYHFFTIWIGLGAAAIAGWLRGEPRQEEARLVEQSGGALFGVGSVLILCLLACLPIRYGWYSHDRSGFYVARDYAYNMLTPLEENAIIYTNGDNDTFPLWYIQEVEGIRKDVRVVNLSLLNTHWYIRQLRDCEPKVRITIPDNRIDLLRGYYTAEGDVVLVKDIMVQHIIDVNQERPIYFAVTVPELMDLEPRLSMEGLVFRVEDEEGEEERMNSEATWHNLREHFLYRGLLDENGYYDDTVYKDKNANKLVQNYVAAYVRLAHHHLKRDEDERALEALDYAGRINPNFPGVLYTKGYLQLEQKDYAGAATSFRTLIDSGDRAPEIFNLLIACHEGSGNLAAAERAYWETIDWHPDEFDVYQNLFVHLWSKDMKGEAISVMERWLVRHPDDSQVRLGMQRFLEEEAARDTSAATDSGGAP